MSGEHTPGPWREGEGGFVIASAPHEGAWSDENNIHFYGGPLICESIRGPANRRLIAAAPELLGALIDLLDSCGSRGTYNAIKVYDATVRAEAAIAKATGQ